MAAEETAPATGLRPSRSSRGVYGIGAGLSAIVHSLAAGALGFRGIFAFAVVPLAVVVAMRSWVEEPSRFMVAQAGGEHPTPVLGAVGPRYRRLVLILCLITFAISVITGPANSFVFLYAQDVVHQKGYVTALMVVAAGILGGLGLLAGRWLGDHLGRRPTGTLAMVAIALTPTLGLLGLVAPRSLSGTCSGVFSGGSSRRRSAPCSPSCSRRPCGRR